MKYIGIPLGMWVLFEKSFRKNLVSEFGYNKITAKQILKTQKADTKALSVICPNLKREISLKQTLSAVQCWVLLYSLCPKDRALTNLSNTIQKR